MEIPLRRLAGALGHGLWAFLRSYLVKRGFLDGRLGFVLAVYIAEGTYYRYLKMALAPAAAAPATPATTFNAFLRSTIPRVPPPSRVDVPLPDSKPVRYPRSR